MFMEEMAGDITGGKRSSRSQSRTAASRSGRKSTVPPPTLDRFNASRVILTRLNEKVLAGIHAHIHKGSLRRMTFKNAEWLSKTPSNRPDGNYWGFNRLFKGGITSSREHLSDM